MNDMTPYTYVLATTLGRHVSTGRVKKHVVDIDLTAGRRGLHDGGAGKPADTPGGPEVRQRLPTVAPEDMKTLLLSRVVALNR